MVDEAAAGGTGVANGPRHQTCQLPFTILAILGDLTYSGGEIDVK